jgi:hypothetical protein
MSLLSKLEAAEAEAAEAQKKQKEAEEFATEEGFLQSLQKDRQILKDKESLWATERMNFRKEICDLRQVATATGKSGTDLVNANIALRQENDALRKENEELRAKYSNVQRLVHSLSRFP